MNAKDLDSLAGQDLINRAIGETTRYSDLLARDARLPSMAQIRQMMGAVTNLIEHSEGVSRIQGNMIDRSGHALAGELLVIGPFTAAYSHDGKQISDLFSRWRQPVCPVPPAFFRHAETACQYMTGKRSSVPVDISRGNALRGLSHQLQLTDQVKRGGPIVWPIVVIFVLGILIVLERSIHLLRTRARTVKVMEQVHAFCENRQFSECEEWLANHAGKPLTRMLLAGVRSFQKNREDLENILQEAILREIPPLERFLSTLGMLVAIAPLLACWARSPE